MVEQPRVRSLPVPQYPSIIRAHNMCYSTMVMRHSPKPEPPVDVYEIETTMGRFAFAQSPQGVVPALLEDLAAYRKQAKRDMAAAKAAGDEWTAALANGRQLAFKITMNSVYGFIGATRGMLPAVPIAASVTATGRAMIRQTKELVERLVPGSRVIYGDTVRSVSRCRLPLSAREYQCASTNARVPTVLSPCAPQDSVMVILDVGDEAKRHDLAAHFALAERVAGEISATFKPPNELEFEKCYYPYLLFSKKRYAGESPKKSLGVRYTMNWLARILAVYLALVLLDAMSRFKLFLKTVHAGAGVWCRVVDPKADRVACAERVFYSRTLWFIISALIGLMAGYVTLQALNTRRW